MRAVRLIAWSLTALLLLSFLGASVALATSPSNRQLARLVERAVPGLALEGVAGALLGRLTVERATLSDADGIWLTIENATVHLSWTALARREVRLSRVEAQSIHVTRLPGGDTAPTAENGPFSLPSLPELPVALRVDALNVPRIELGPAMPGGAATLSAQGSAHLAGDRGGVQLVIRRLDQPGTADLVAELEGDRLTARLVASEPPGGVVAGFAGQPDAPFAAEVTLNANAWGVNASLGATAVEGAGQLALEGGAVTASGRLDVRPGPFLPETMTQLAETAALEFALRYSAEGDLTLDRVIATAPAGRLEGRATVAASGALAGQARLDPGAAALFAPFLPEGVAWREASANATFGGTLDDPSVTLAARLADPRTNTPADPLLGETVTLDARYAQGGRDIALHLRGARLEAQVEGAAPDFGTGTLALDVAASVTDPPEVEGTVTLRGRLTGTAQAPELDGVLETQRVVYADRVAGPLRVAVQASPTLLALDVAGTVDNRPLTLRVNASQDSEGRLLLRELDGAYARATLRGEGDFALPDGPHRADLRLSVPSLGALVPGASGSLTAEARTTIIPGAEGPAAQGIALRVNSPGFSVAGQSGRLELRLEGTLAQAVLRLTAANADANVEAAARITTGEVTEAVFTRLNLRAGEDAAQLQGNATLTRAANGDFTLAPARFTSARGGRLLVQGQLRGEAITGQAELQALPLGPFTAGAAQGTVSGQLRVSGPVAAPEARFTLAGEGLGATALPGLPPAQLRATGQASATAAQIEAQVNAGPGVALTINASQANGLGADAATEARLRGRLDLEALTRPILAGSGNRMAGRADVDLRLAGTIAAPRLSGTANVTGGSLRNLEQGVRLDGISARIVAEGERLLLQQFAARTQGGGTVSAQGWVEPLGENIPAELRLTARDARPVQSELGEAVMSADLQLRGPLLAGGSLSGRVDISRAEIRIPEEFGGSIPTLGEVREIGPLPEGRPARTPAETAAPTMAPAGPPLALDLTIAAPRAIFVRGRGLEAELSGNLRVRGNLTDPEVAGAFNLRRGSFDLAGRNLALQRGEARFDTGTLMPSLDFLATSRSRAHTITLTITGTPAAPTLTVGAQPDLPQDEALARLLFDRELTRLSPFEIASLTQAVGQLAGIMPAGGGVTGRIREALGLDRLSAGAAEEGGGATIEAGRYVAPGVYVGVRQGTGGAPPGVGVQVEITPRLRLEAETQTGPGGDRLGLSWGFEY